MTSLMLAMLLLGITVSTGRTDSQDDATSPPPPAGDAPVWLRGNTHPRKTAGY